MSNIKNIYYSCSFFDNYEVVGNLNRIVPNNNIITWSLGNSNENLAKDDIKKMIASAFNEIERYIEPIKFQYSESFNAANIKIAFTPKNQHLNFIDGIGDEIEITTPFQFDGRFGTLAMAFYPIQNEFKGILLFDMDEKWSTYHDNEKGYIDLITVALHEILHVLGLKHSSVKDSVMHSEYIGLKRNLKNDDIMGIRKIYKDLIYPIKKYDGLQDRNMFSKIWREIKRFFRKLFGN